jgi:hypothetical protein
MRSTPLLTEMFIAKMNSTKSMIKDDEMSEEYSLSSEETSVSEEEDLTSEDIFDDVDVQLTLRRSSSNDTLSQVSSISTSQEDLDAISKRASKRAMNTEQEVWNAITMLIAPCYCLYFVLSGKWLTAADLEALSTSDTNNISRYHGCIPKPPLTVIAIVLGIVLHTPASVLYHVLCAFKIPQGPMRINHWSRRLDQAMIHVVSIFWSFGSSGQWTYTLLSMIFNVDSIIGLYRRPFCPRKIFYRFGVALTIQTLPLFINGRPDHIIRLLAIYIASGLMFTKYPLGGYSHGMFHILIAFAPPLVLVASVQLPSVQNELRIAATCAHLKQI